MFINDRNIVAVMTSLRDQFKEVNNTVDFPQTPFFKVATRLRDQLMERDFNKEMAEDVIANMDIQVDPAFCDTDEKLELLNDLVDNMAEMIYKSYEAYKIEFSRWEVFIKMIEGADIKLTVND